MKVKKLNNSNYKIYMIKIHYSQKVGYMHSHKNASIILRFIKPNKQSNLVILHIIHDILIQGQMVLRLSTIKSTFLSEYIFMTSCRVKG